MSVTRPTSVRSIYVDLRCLQDAGSADHEIGVHIADLLRERPSCAWRDTRVVGLLDPALPELARHLRPLCDDTTFCLNPVTHPGRLDVFIQSSPMTHDIADTWAFRRGRGILAVAIVHDFSLCERPGLMSPRAQRIEYLAKLARLRNYDCFFPVSPACARQLRDLIGIEERRVCVTGAETASEPDRRGERFWGGLTAALSAAEARPQRFSIGRKRLPRLAYFSPYPPDRSGIAAFSEQVLAAAGQRFEVSLYTDAPGPLRLPAHVCHAGPVTYAPLVNGAYEASLLVIGNSQSHSPIAGIAERYGGPLVLHDSPMTEHPPARCFKSLLIRADPVLVHSVALQKLLRDRNGARCQVLPFPPLRQFAGEELASAHREEVRLKLGLAPGAFVISTFGDAVAWQASAMCIVGLELLRSWQVPAEMHFVGAVGGAANDLRRVARQYGVADRVHWAEDQADGRRCRDYLIASDAAIQLRPHGFGQTSHTLANCASAGLPTIARQGLIEACGAPEYCKGLEELHSPLELAELLAGIAGGARGQWRDSAARAAYLATNNFGRYAAAVAEALGYE